ncbi:MAG: hypothetical protein WCY93_10780 [Anaerolineaceae bacterium]
MRLGTETGSLVNHLSTRGTSTVKPEVGMGATVYGWTDRHAATVVSVEGNIFTVQHDRAVRTDDNGMSEMQKYTFSADPEGIKDSYRIEKDGRFTEVRKNPETGRWNKVGKGNVRLGFRDHYYDFSF